MFPNGALQSASPPSPRSGMMAELSFVMPAHSQLVCLLHIDFTSKEKFRLFLPPGQSRVVLMGIKEIEQRLSSTILIDQWKNCSIKMML